MFQGHDSDAAAISAAQQLVHEAAARGDLATVRQAAAAPPGVLTARHTQWPGWCPLHVAALHGHAAVVACLLEAAPEAALVQDVSGRTPLHVAVECNHQECARRLVAAVPAAACIQDCYGRTPLAVAARLGHEAAVRCLLELAPQAAALSSRLGRASPLQVSRQA